MENKRNGAVFLFIDTETGGLNPFVHSLFSIGYVISRLEIDNLVYKFETLDENEIFVYEDDYHCVQEAMTINGLNMEDVKLKGISKADIVAKFCELKNRFFDGKPMVVVGHNIDFDLCFLRKIYSSESIDFNRDFHYRTVNTSSILKYLYYSGKMPTEISSLDDATTYFSIGIKKRHNALDDCKGTVFLFEKLLNKSKL